MNSLVTHNSKAWDNKVESGNEWTVAVEKRIIEKGQKRGVGYKVNAD